MEALEARQSELPPLEEQASSGIRVADKYVRNHPYESLGIALGLGLVAGVLLNRK
jgi:ElaB/YqjD/DUF883 family membrane-anchored ribosome-binding protein